MRILVDTNILIRLANGAGDPLFADAVAALETLRRVGHVPTLVPQNLYEFWAVVTRPVADNGLGMSTTEANGEFQRLDVPLFRVLHDERAIFPKWRELVTSYEIQGKTTHDAHLVAAMLRHGISHLLTFNERHFNQFRDIFVVTPKTVASGSVPNSSGNG